MPHTFTIKCSTQTLKEGHGEGPMRAIVVMSPEQKQRERENIFIILICVTNTQPHWAYISVYIHNL